MRDLSLTGSHSQQLVNGWTLLARTADIVGLVAFGLVLIGLVVSYLTRPRLTIKSVTTDNGILTVWFAYGKGSRQATNINVEIAGIDSKGAAVLGDGSFWRAPSLLPGEGEWLVVSPPEVDVFEDSTGKSARMRVDKDLGVILIMTWDHSVIQSIKTRWVLLWSAADRSAKQPPLVLKGRKATAAVAAMRPKSTP